MTPANRITFARYAARLTDICFGVLLATLLIKGATFAALASPVFLLTLTVAVVTWLSHVLQLFADTGSLPVEPPAAAERPAPVAPPEVPMLIAPPGT